jgi:succinate dehydrogenase flavin-adding protein (antitoxin of CptAB toxin-antitoxin module)
LTAALAAKILDAIMKHRIKHRIRRGMLAALIAGVTFFYPLLAPTPHRIDEAHFRQIQAGMTRAQVEAIFGAPPGEYDWAEADGSALAFFQSAIALSVRTPPASPVLIDIGSDKTIASKTWVITAGGEARWSDVIGTINAVQLGTPRNQIRYWIAYDASRTRTWISRHGSFEIQFGDNDLVTWTNHHSEVRIVPPWERAWRWWKSK